jgi:hypothetical protein
VRRQPELVPERARASQPELAPVRALEPASQQERALARALPAVVGPALWWLKERVSRPATCRAVRVDS